MAGAVDAAVVAEIAVKPKARATPASCTGPGERERAGRRRGPSGGRPEFAARAAEWWTGWADAAGTRAGGQAGAGNNQGNAADDQAPRTAGTTFLTGNGCGRRPTQIGGGNGGLGGSSIGQNTGPITGNDFVDWSDRMRDVEQAVDSQDVRNQLATVRERVGAYRQTFRQNGRAPTKEELQAKALAPLTLARDWVGQELSRAEKDNSLVPLDRDPVQAKYSEAVRQYYEKLGSPQ